MADPFKIHIHCLVWQTSKEWKIKQTLYVYFSQAIIYCWRALKSYFKNRFWRTKSRGTCLNIHNFRSIILFWKQSLYTWGFAWKCYFDDRETIWLDTIKNILPFPCKWNWLFDIESDNNVEENLKIPWKYLAVTYVWQ